MKIIKATLLSIILLMAVSAIASNTTSNENFAEESVETIKQNITDKHPLSYIVLATKLMDEGKLDEAAKWYYVGQIRFRAYLTANPDLAPTGDPALYSALMYVVGTPINEYAGQNTDNWVKLLEDALNWHRNNPNGFTPKAENKEIYDEIESNVLWLRDYILGNEEEIRQRRTQNGLKNY